MFRSSILSLVVLLAALPCGAAPVDDANDQMFSGRRNAVVRAAERATMGEDVFGEHAEESECQSEEHNPLHRVSLLSLIDRCM